MMTFSLDATPHSEMPKTPTHRMAQLMSLFGLRQQTHPVNTPPPTDKKLHLRPGDICYITGASGCGKSLLLRRLYEQTPAHDRLWLNDIALAANQSLIDCFDDDLFDTLELLNRAGLSDAPAMLQTLDRLSEGQQYRCRLAKALASSKSIVFADEFCSTLDRLTAAVISHNLRKISRQSERIFILAGAHDDLLIDLLPDIVIVKYLSGRTDIIRKK